jgi:hypothetical protein
VDGQQDFKPKATLIKSTHRSRVTGIALRSNQSAAKKSVRRGAAVGGVEVVKL